MIIVFNSNLDKKTDTQQLHKANQFPNFWSRNRIHSENTLRFGFESDGNMEVAWFKYALWSKQLIEQ